jgi:hypothetical protein
MRHFHKFVAVLYLSMVLVLGGCVMLTSSSISDSTKTGAGNTATASVSDWGILMLTIPEGLTAAANQQLASACPSGRFTDVQTELSMRNFFVAQKYEVDAVAICQ